jgi:four helix bundle protein
METFETELKNKNRGYLRLIVWQKAMQLFELTHRIASADPRIDFKLRAQFTDAAQSISANIAEGYGRRSIKEYIQFLYIALGSAAEVFTRAIGLQTIAHITTTRFDEFNRLHYEVENRLLRLVERLEEKRDRGEWKSRIAETEEEDGDLVISLQHSNTPTLPHPDRIHA